MEEGSDDGGGGVDVHVDAEAVASGIANGTQARVSQFCWPETSTEKFRGTVNSISLEEVTFLLQSQSRLSSLLTIPSPFNHHQALQPLQTCRP